MNLLRKRKLVRVAQFRLGMIIELRKAFFKGFYKGSVVDIRNKPQYVHYRVSDSSLKNEIGKLYRLDENVFKVWDIYEA